MNDEYPDEERDIYKKNLLDLYHLNGYLYSKLRDEIIVYFQKILSGKSLDINYKKRYTDSLIVNIGLIIIKKLKKYIEDEQVFATYIHYTYSPTKQEEELKKKIINFVKKDNSQFSKKECLLVFSLGYHLLHRFYEDINDFEAEYLKAIKKKQKEMKAEATSVLSRSYRSHLARKQLKTIKEAKAAPKAVPKAAPKFNLKPLPKGIARVPQPPASSSLKSGDREKVLNEKTGRYVYKDGATAKKLGLSK